jgi:hypothetical protein
MEKLSTIVNRVCAGRCVVAAIAIVALSATAVWAQGKGEKSFQALATDAKGVETEIKDVIF